MNKDIKEFLRYFSLVIGIFFLESLVEHYITINWNVSYAWIGLIFAAFAFYYLSKNI